MKFDAIAFDLEGTLVDVEFAHHEGHVRAAREVGVHLTIAQAVLELPHFVGGPDEAVAQEIFDKSDGKVPMHEIFDSDQRWFKKLLAEQNTIAPREGAREFIDDLRRLGVPIAIGSLTTSDLAWLLLDKSGLASCFEKKRVVLREDVENAKPAPDVYLETARRLSVESAKQLVFEDSVGGVAAARAAGSVVHAVPTISSSQFRHRLKAAGASRVFDSWHSVSNEALGVVRIKGAR